MCYVITDTWDRFSALTLWAELRIACNQSVTENLLTKQKQTAVEDYYE